MIGTNVGHGHVWLRPDGLKARCGGPALCSECARDLASHNGRSGVGRRSRVDLLVKEERALLDALIAVEALGAHPLLTDCVVAIGAARDRLADWIDTEQPGAARTEPDQVLEKL